MTNQFSDEPEIHATILLQAEGVDISNIRSRRYNWRHREQRNQESREYCKKTGYKAQKKFRENNPERVKQIVKKSQIKNQYKQNTKKWNEEHPEKNLGYSRKQRWFKKMEREILLSDVMLIKPKRKKQSKVACEKKSIIMKKNWEKPEYRKKREETFAKPEVKEKQRLAKEDYVPWNKGRIPTEKELKHLKEMRKFAIMPNKDSSIERKLQEYLTESKIEFKKHPPLDGQPDIFIEPNICIFCDGEYFHGDPRKYKANDIVGIDNIAWKVWYYDKNINEKLESQGYTVLRFWEKEIKKNIIDCLNKIKEETSKSNKREVRE